MLAALTSSAQIKKLSLNDLVPMSCLDDGFLSIQISFICVFAKGQMLLLTIRAVLTFYCVLVCCRSLPLDRSSVISPYVTQGKVYL